MSDYYKRLGVSKTASDDEIKKAYKKMALKWHPDRNNGSEEASQKFKEISEAFEVLSDKQKRTIYDQFGEEGLRGGGGPSPGAGAGPGGFPAGGFSGFPGGGGTTFSFSSGGDGGFHPTDPNKIFEQFFGGFGGFGGGMGGASSRPQRRGASRMNSMGGMGGMFSGFDSDDEMDGSTFGGMPGAMPRTQSGGPRASKPSAPSEITRPIQVSLNELQSGATKKLKVGRRLANGTTEEKVVTIDVQPGWKSGTKVRFAKMGNEIAPGQSQDLVFVVEEKPHPTFTREGDDLVTRVQIPLVEALTGEGGKKVIELLNGKKLSVAPPSGIVKPDQETTVYDQGMPIRKGGATSQKGKLRIKWEVKFPTSLTPTQKQKVKEALA